MQILVTGGAGFLGTRLIEALLKVRDADFGEITAVTCLDMTSCPIDDSRVRSVVGDIRDSKLISACLSDAPDVVYHLAAVVSSQAEADFELGTKVNIDATRELLEGCRDLGTCPRFVFASSLAVFGAGLIEPVAENVAPKPQSSYGIQKAIGELLVNDYSRRGFLDGRVCRLPTIVVRPGRPNQAASSFASSIIREPLSGKRATCPVSADLGMWVSSPRTVTRNLVHAAKVPREKFGDWRTINLPGIKVTVQDMIVALETLAGTDATALISFKREYAIERIAASWPGELDTTTSQMLGFERDHNFEKIINAYIEEDMIT